MNQTNLKTDSLGRWLPVWQWLASYDRAWLQRDFVAGLTTPLACLDCSAIPDFEYTALKMLTEAEKRLQQIGISLWLAGLNPEPLELVQKSALGKTLGRSRMHFNLDQAVRNYLKQLGDAQREGQDPAGQRLRR